MEKVPCIIIDSKQAEEVALIDNIQRADLHPVEIGDGINSLLCNSEWGSISKLATKLGKDQHTISHYLSYSKLPESIKRHLVEKDIRSREILRNLLKCKNIETMEEILRLKQKDKHFTSKSVLKISLNSNNFKIQDKALYSLNKDQLKILRYHLQEIVDKIESLS